MTDDFVTYRKFSDSESAEEVCELLRDSEIEYRLIDSSHNYLKVVGYSQIDPGVIINIQSKDFSRADKILDSYYSKQTENVHKSHYIFEFSDDELKEIVKNPYDWGVLDFHLARKILLEKGFNFSEDYIKERRDEKLKKLSEIKKVSLYKLILGYAFSFLLPPVGLIVGLLIVNTKNVLPNGEKHNTYTKTDRMHGQIMIVLSIVWAGILILQLALSNKSVV